jgi:DNA-damage-inducible protein J
MAKAVTINARVDRETKTKANNIFQSLGLTTTQAICLFLKQVIYHKGIPFDVKIPDKATLKAVKELEAGKGKRVKSVDELFKELKS